MLEQPAGKPKQPLTRWQAESWQLLVEDLLAGQRYTEAEQWALTYLKRPGIPVRTGEVPSAPPQAADTATVPDPSADYMERIRRAYLEALYRQEKDSELLAAIQAYYPVYATAPEQMTPAAARFKYEEYPELLLYWAVAACRTNREDWPAAFRELFLYVNSGDLHLRTYRFLSSEPARQSRFSPETWDLLTGKYCLLAGEQAKGMALLEKILAECPPAELAATKVIKELAFAYLNTGAFSQGIRFFDKLRTRFAACDWPAAHTRMLEAKEMQARLYRGKKFYQQAIPLLREVAGTTTDKKQRDRVLWFILDMQLKLSPAKGLQELKASFVQWEDPTYFLDLLDELVHLLAEKKDWDGMYELYQSLTVKTAENLPAPVREFTDRLSYLLEHYYTSVPREQPPALPVLKKRQPAAENNYYTLLSAYEQNNLQTFFADPASLAAKQADTLPGPAEELPADRTNQPIQPLDTLQPDSASSGAADLPTDPTVPAATVTAPAFTEEETYIRDFFTYGLNQAGFLAATRGVRRIRLSLLQEIVRMLQDRRCYYQSINLAYYYLGRKNTPPTAADYRLIYPRGYEEYIEPLAKEWDLPSWLLYTLVWAESAFKADIKSPAGAVGLAQLMPATAEEMAQRLKLANPDLTNPAHNLRLGTYYYARLHKRYQDALKAFMAYNAGPTRVRQWTKELARYPAELYTEVLPIAETRKYIRKIIHTAVCYAYLYNQQSPADVIRSFYPGLPVSGNAAGTAAAPTASPAAPGKQPTKH
jgi:hypothetical protein